MRRLVVIGFISLSVFGCQSSADLNKVFTVKTKINQLEQVASNLTIEVIHVADSRCPEGCECIWAGEVKVSFTVSDNWTSVDTSLVLPSRPRLEFRNYRIELQTVNPYPICNYEFPSTCTISFAIDDLNKETLLVQGSLSSQR